MTEKHKVRIAVFVILEKGDEILLLRRANTGYADGQYQMPSGHIEVDEYPTEAAIREAKEEVGVDIETDDIKLVHTSYRISPDNHEYDYIDFFFKTNKWSNEPINAEPETCDEIVWAPIKNLPSNTVPVIKEVIEYIYKGISFSEIGRE